MYITTAISYTNGPPHIGHAYEVVSADIFARYYRQIGKSTYLLTGTDEHGQKIATTAALLGLSPQALCDRNSGLFRGLAARLQISNNAFIRTTDAEHVRHAQVVFQAIAAKGDIYLGTYTGWYNPREEHFITEKDAAATDYKDPLTQAPYMKVDEPSYFFRIEPYRIAIRDHIINHTDFLMSEQRNDILKRLEEPLHDLSISRTTFTWGIPIPTQSNVTDDSASAGHVMYVWFEALINYLSGRSDTNVDSSPDLTQWGTHGPPIHVIGKDIIWFHAVIWSAMLLSLGLPLSRRLIVHGFIQDPDGCKMSKSLNNVVDPCDLLTKYSSDVLRYSLIRAGVYGYDITYSEAQIVQANDELANWYGNLVSRVFALSRKYCQSLITPSNNSLSTIDSKQLLRTVTEAIDQGRLSTALDAIMQEVQKTNQWLDHEAPWKSTTPAIYRCEVLRCALEKILILTHFLLSYIPAATTHVFQRYNFIPLTLSQLNDYNLQIGVSIDDSKLILFEKSKNERK